MKLSELEPRFVRYETRGGTEYNHMVESLTEAQGIEFLCPACFAKNSGSIGTHGIHVTFRNRGALDAQGSHGRTGSPSRWDVTGSSHADLTLTPSIDTTPSCTWHGHVTNGEIK